MAAITFAISTPSTSNVTSYPSGSFTPAAGDLLLVFVHAAGTVAAGTMSDSQGLGFSKVTSVLSASSVDTTYCFVSNAFAANSSMTVTFDCTGDAATGAIITVYRVSGMSIVGASAVRQFQTVANHAAGTPAPVFSTVALTGNPTFGAISNATNPATMTPPTGWTEGADSGFATPTTGLESVWRNSGFTGTTVTWGSSSSTAYAAIIVELLASSAAIFSDGFESGDLSAWSSSSTDGGDLSATTAAALHGNYGLSTLINDTNNIFVSDNTPNDEKRYRVRFYFDPNSISMPNASTVNIFLAQDDALNAQFFVWLEMDSGVYNINVMDATNGAFSAGVFNNAISDAPHCLEIDWKASHAPGANDGFLTLWIDGTQVGTATGIASDTEKIQTNMMGANSVTSGISGTYYLDDFASNRDGSPIGLITSQTQTGKANITAATTTTTKTQTGTARIGLVTTKTQTGTSRITVQDTKTQAGVANITPATTTTPQTQSGVSRIQQTTGKTQAGKSRITKAATKTQTGISRLTSVTTKTQSGKSRVTNTTPKTQPGKARVTTVTPKTQTGKSRATVSSQKTQPAIARIQQAGTKTILGQARITAATAKTQSGKARVTATTTQTQSGTAHIVFPLIGTLQDDFEFGGIDSGKWTATNSQVVIGTNLDLELSSTLGGNYVSLNSIASYDLTGSKTCIEVTDAGDQTITSWEVYPIYLVADANNKLFIRIAGNSVQAIKVVAGTTTNAGSSVTYNATTMKWFQIRESAGTVYFEYTADPTGSWTTLTSLATPITITALTYEVLIGTWQAESTTTTAKLDNVNVTPGEFQFSWKGYTWNKRIQAGDPSNHQTWSPDNITGPDGNGYLTVSLTNPDLNSPVGAELFSAQRGFGYGTYTSVIGTELDTMDHKVGFGGLFTFDFTAPPDYREIDTHETRDYASQANIQILHSHAWDNSGSRSFTTDNMDITSDVVQTHRLIWEPGKLTFDAFVGTGTGGTNYFHTEQTTNVPTPGLERVHFNVWSNTGVAGYASGTPIDVVIRDFSFTATTTQTTTGESRITGITSQTILGQSRLTATTSKTQTGQADIRESTSRTQSGVGRIIQTTSRTQSGTARITKTSSHTQPGKARITAATTRTQTGTADLLNVSTKTQAGQARFTQIVPHDQTGKARITNTSQKTIAGHARITAITAQDQSGKASVVNTTTQSQTGITRVIATTDEIQLGKTAIKKTTEQTQTGLARVALITSHTQAGQSRITAATAETLSGKARVIGTTTKTVTGITRLTIVTDKTQNGLASVASGATRTQGGVSRVTASTPRTQDGRADIQRTTTKTQAGVSRIGLTTTKTQHGLSRVTDVTKKLQTGIADIFATTDQTQTGTATIGSSNHRTQTGTADVAKLVTRDQTGTARIQLLTDRIVAGVARLTSMVTRMQTGQTRITQTVSQTQAGTADLLKGSSKLQSGIARVIQKVGHTQAGTARILQIRQQTQSGISRLAILRSHDQAGIARLSQSRNITQTGTAAIITLTHQDQLGKANLVGVTTHDQTGRALIVRVIHPPTNGGTTLTLGSASGGSTALTLASAGNGTTRLTLGNPNGGSATATIGSPTGGSARSTLAAPQSVNR